MQVSVSFLALIPLALWPAMAQARGGGHMGFGSGLGHGAGLYGGYRGHAHGLHVPNDHRLNPSAVEASTLAAIEMTTGDATALPGFADKLNESLSAFNGRLIANDTRPDAVSGTPPGAFFLVAFNTPLDADHWKASQPFKDFEADFQKAGGRIFTVNVLPSTLPVPSNERRSLRRQEEDRAYRKLIESGDRTLKKIQDICRNC